MKRELDRICRLSSWNSELPSSAFSVLFVSFLFSKSKKYNDLYGSSFSSIIQYFFFFLFVISSRFSEKITQHTQHNSIIEGKSIIPRIPYFFLCFVH